MEANINEGTIYRGTVNISQKALKNGAPHNLFVNSVKTYVKVSPSSGLFQLPMIAVGDTNVPPQNITPGNFTMTYDVLMAFAFEIPGYKRSTKGILTNVAGYSPATGYHYWNDYPDTTTNPAKLLMVIAYKNPLTNAEETMTIELATLNVTTDITPSFTPPVFSFDVALV